MIFGGCETGFGASNFVTRAIARVSASAIGWRGTICVSDVNTWIPRFQYRIYQGYTVQQAVTYANSFGDYNYNPITDVNMLGGSTIPHYGSTASLSELAEAANVDYLQEYTAKYPLDDDVEQSLIDCIVATTGILCGGQSLCDQCLLAGGDRDHFIQLAVRQKYQLCRKIRGGMVFHPVNEIRQYPKGGQSRSVDGFICMIVVQVAAVIVLNTPGVGEMTQYFYDLVLFARDTYAEAVDGKGGDTG